jgi:hypothetical protein
MMRDRNKIYAIFNVTMMVAAVLSCGCIELDKQTRSVGTTLAGGELTTRTYLWDEGGFLDKTYDVVVRIAGVKVVDVKGITQKDLDKLTQTYESILNDISPAKR